jgi:MFS family permease
VFYVLLATMASYAIDDFHASTSVAGLVTGIFLIGAIIGRLLTGRLIEEKGSKRLLLIGITLNLLTSALYFFATTLPLLLLNRLLHGVATGIGSTAAATIIAQIVPHGRRGEGLAYYSMSLVLGVAVGPFVGLLLIEHFHYSAIFLFNVLLVAISLLLAFLINEPAHHPSRQVHAKAQRSFALSDFLEFKAMPIATVSLIAALGYSSVFTFLSVYSRHIQLTEAASYYFLVYATVVVLTRPFSGRLLDARGANVVVYPCLLIYTAGVLVLSQAAHGGTLLCAGALMAVGFGNYQSSAQAIAVKVVPRHRLGLATSTYLTFFDLGYAIGPYLFGCLEPVTGFRGLYIVVAAVILADVALYYVLQGRRAIQHDFRDAETKPDRQ